MRNLFWSDPYFQSAWGEDFDTMRKDTVQGHQRLLEKFGQDPSKLCERCAKEADEVNYGGKEVEKKQDDDDENAKKILPLFLPPRFWLCLDDLVEGEGFIQPVDQLIRIKEDESKFEISLDTHEYHPDEVKVHVHNNILTVEARHDENSEDGTMVGSRHFFRKYTLPEGCQSETVISNLSSDDVLMITAPKNPSLIQEDRDVPISITNENLKEELHIEKNCSL